MVVSKVLADHVVWLGLAIHQVPKDKNGANLSLDETKIKKALDV